MNTCATCKWWTDITSQYDGLSHPELITHDPASFQVSRQPMPDRWGYCTKVDELEPESLQTQFYVTDGSDYKATLHTRETFGCNQWEPNDP